MAHDINLQNLHFFSLLILHLKLNSSILLWFLATASAEQFSFKKVMMFHNTYNLCPNLQGKIKKK